MIHARLRPLLVLVALLGLALLARLFQVQIVEHPIWAGEAARLVFSGREEPYRRGRILDAAGRVLARDEEQRAVVLVYRQFRRAHPLGQVAHGHSLLAGRPVSLAETRDHLLEWARGLVELRPADLRAAGRGAATAEGPSELAGELADERLRARRLVDLVFYVRRLLRLDDKDEWKALLAAEAEDQEGTARSFLALTAAVRGRRGPEGVELEWSELESRLRHALERLDLFARWIQPEGVAGTPDEREPLARLIAQLEDARRKVEDATAAKLFAEATGFAPGRLEEDTLLECFDHGWITDLLGWDRARLAEWAAVVRRGWMTGWRDEECLPQLLWELALDPSRTSGPGDFLDRVSVAYEPEGALQDAIDHGPRPWRQVDQLAVFADLAGAIAADVPAAAARLGRAALPIQIEELRTDPDPARPLPAGRGADSFRARLEEALAGRSRTDVATLQSLAGELNELWELRFQEVLRRVLDEVRRAADADELGPEGGLLLAEENRDRAAERAEYFLKDYGMRKRPVVSQDPGRGPTFDVIYLLTRYDADFPGLEVRALSTRELVHFADEDERPADLLIGRVSAPTLDEMLRQRVARSRKQALMARPDREEQEAEELKRLIGEVKEPTEVKGVSGVEAFFEPELAGQPGYFETRGLAGVVAGEDEVPLREPIDGADVVLTLDAGLQAAAQRCLRHPQGGDDDRSDEDWRANPVGAIVLLTREGDVLAAASEPDDQSLIAPGALEQRLNPAERTLGKPAFQPPGSVFKPFVAAWALDHGLDPLHTVTCGPIARGGFGYEDLRCGNPHGHGPVDLHAALVQSCNAYFAWLGETLNTNQLAELCADFGFGQPTGVRRPPPWDGGERRSGLREALAGFMVQKDKELSDSLRRRAANGLSVVEATPMQLARAALALATGEKRELRVVQRVGAREFPRAEPEPLPISASSLDFVRQAMRGVADDANGTAHGALSHERLGFHVAAKTGSADLESPREVDGHTVVPKHAWVAGWAPAKDPKIVFVVFEHRTMATSSHGAIYLARQLLQQPEVLSYLADAGADVSGVKAQ